MSDAAEPTQNDTAEHPDVAAQLDELRAAIDELAKQQRLTSGRLARIGAQIESLVRLSVDRQLWPSEPQYLLNYRRFGLSSQNGEEGMLAALLGLLGPPLGRFVEIGCGGNGGNSGLFAGELGWEGLMVDRLGPAVDLCRQRFGHNQRLRFVTATVSPANVDDIVRDAGLDGEIDYVSIDIDSTDYWVLEALTACAPRALVLEYNAYLGPDRSVTVAQDVDFEAAPKGYYGASLTALAKLAKRKGYRLLGCEETGVNAFFLRVDIEPDLRAVDPKIAFRTIKAPLGRRREGLPRDQDKVLSVVLRSGLPLIEV